MGPDWKAQVVKFLLVTSVNLSICYTCCLQFIKEKPIHDKSFLTVINKFRIRSACVIVLCGLLLFYSVIC